MVLLPSETILANGLPKYPPHKNLQDNSQVSIKTQDPITTQLEGDSIHLSTHINREHKNKISQTEIKVFLIEV